MAKKIKTKRRSAKQLVPAPMPMGAIAGMGSVNGMPKPKVMPAGPPPMAPRPRVGVQVKNNLAMAMKGRK